MMPQGLSPTEMIATALCLLLAAMGLWYVLVDCVRLLGFGRWPVERLPLRKVCAWCGGEISAGRGPASHGICPRCERTHFPSTERAA